MTTSAVPINENFRLEALKSLEVLDTESQSEFDEITALAAYLCDTNIAVISLVDSDRQWFKAKHGINKTCQIPRENSLFSHAILDPDHTLIVEDVSKDKRFNKAPIFLEDTHVLFYAGVPLVDKNGFALGTLFIVDDKPRSLTEKQLESLKAFAKQVVILFELNKKNNDLEKIQKKLKKRNESLREFAKVISHDLKMPLANIITSTDLLKLLLNDKLDEDSKQYFEYIKASSFSMSSYISDVLQHYESENLINSQPENFDLNDLLKEVIEFLSIKSDCDISFPKGDTTIECNKSALKQVFVNLISNSIKYNDKEKLIISIDFNKDDMFYYFSIADNGMGIPNDKIETIFELFTTANTTDKDGNKGNGIGLSTVKKLVTSLGGCIKVSSKEKISTTFEFSIKKCKKQTNTSKSA
ncbi:sensor histidine kinase [Aquimarina algicola]|nr:GAF domain-containing sensor histidine kinase [Aquimarina algicola]